MNRSFWFVAGAGAGIYASFRARRVAEAFTSDGISDRISALQLGGRLLREDIATAAAEREVELRAHISSGFMTALRAPSTSDTPALPPAHHGDAAQHQEDKELS